MEQFPICRLRLPANLDGLNTIRISINCKKSQPHTMVDKFTTETRSKIMSLIKGKNTKPELVIRKSLHALGFRYRLHDKKIPGQPDIVFPKYKAVIMVNGCFWHGHDCHIFKLPKSKTEFWLNKITKNTHRDEKNKILLLKLGWRVAVVWECAIFGKTKLPFDELLICLSDWIKNGNKEIMLEGINKAVLTNGVTAN